MKIARDGRLGLLMNNAGMGDFGRFTERDPDIEERIASLFTSRMVSVPAWSQPQRARKRKAPRRS